MGISASDEAPREWMDGWWMDGKVDGWVDDTGMNGVNNTNVVLTDMDEPTDWTRSMICEVSVGCESAVRCRWLSGVCMEAIE